MAGCTDVVHVVVVTRIARAGGRTQGPIQCRVASGTVGGQGPCTGRTGHMARSAQLGCHGRLVVPDIAVAFICGWVEDSMGGRVTAQAVSQGTRRAGQASGMARTAELSGSPCVEVPIHTGTKLGCRAVSPMLGRRVAGIAGQPR